jgi:hypothetical protein
MPPSNSTCLLCTYRSFVFNNRVAVDSFLFWNLTTHLSLATIIFLNKKLFFCRKKIKIFLKLILDSKSSITKTLDQCLSYNLQLLTLSQAYKLILFHLVFFVGESFLKILKSCHKMSCVSCIRLKTVLATKKSLKKSSGYFESL